MELSPLRQLLAGTLPKMVQWYHPRLLARVWVRTIISDVFGEYADQRLLQAATDRADEDELIARYDYSDLSNVDPEHLLRSDPGGGVWIDYIADTGDGFESTYAMAYMLSMEQLDVGNGEKLPRGEILIFGGDQAYPQATREEYEKRFILPLSWAHTSSANKRKAFAIPGNHDWYDGLASFDSLFCAARGNLSGGKGNTVGGWNFKQHRSYWALKLPHNWWIWGADIQFSKYLDSAQVNYFEAIAKRMGPEDNLIICLAEPAWLLADQQGLDNEENLFKLATIAHRHGAKVSAVIAGDWHHYNRYHASEIGAHFFTAGGGGAFMHSTHVLKNDIAISWPDYVADEDEQLVAQTNETPTQAKAQASPKKLKPLKDKIVGAQGERWSAHKVGMKLKDRSLLTKAERATKAALAPAEHALQSATDTLAQNLDPAGQTAGRQVGGQMGATTPDGQEPSAVSLKTRTTERAPKCFPSKSVSRLLSLRNLWFPISNPGFAIGIALIYWFITWRFHVITKDLGISSGAIDAATFESYWSIWKFLPLYVAQAMFGGVSFVLTFFVLGTVLVWYVHATSQRGFRRWFVKGTVGLTHFAAHLVAMFSILLLMISFHNWLAPQLEPHVERLLQWQTSSDSVVSEIVQETLAPLSKQGQEQRNIVIKGTQGASGTRSMVPDEGLPPLLTLPETTTKVERSAVREAVGFLYPFEVALLGGLLGGFIWGLYWVLAGLIGRMHAEDAFAALSIKNHKNFLRMRIDPDKLTIYPIGLDRVPGKFGWRNAPEQGSSLINQPRLIATPELKPELIEDPIVIYSVHREHIA